MLLSVSGRLWVPPDLAHFMMKERPARKMSECIYLSHCQAQLQRKVILKRDQAFRSYHPKRFKTSFQKSGGTSLLINGSSTSDPSSVLPVWADHFSYLGISHLSANPSLQGISNTIPEVEIATLVEEERIPDVSFLPASQVLAWQSFRCYCEFRSNSLSVQNGHHRSHLQGQGEGPPPT